MFSTYQQNVYRKLMVMILCRIPSPSMLQPIRDPLSISSWQKDIFDKPFQGSFIFPKDFVYKCLSTHTVVTEKGSMWKGPKEAMKICSPKSFICTAHCLWSLQFVICDCTGYLGISYLLQRHLKKARVMCEPALEARQAWAGKRERHYHVTVWKIFSVDPDFTEHLLAAH